MRNNRTPPTRFDKYGTILRNDKTDNFVFLQNNDNTIKKIGEIGKAIDVTAIMPNLLKHHAKEAEKCNVKDFYYLVKGDGWWDLKKNKTTIFGVAWEYDEDLKNKTKIEKHTKFSWNQHYTFADAADVGNYHAGYMGKFIGGQGIADNTLALAAGLAETIKQVLDNNGSLKQFGISLWYLSRLTVSGTCTLLVSSGNPPFGAGDNFTDYYWNKQGMSDAKKEKHK